jgi:hypothetical protein
MPCAAESRSAASNKEEAAEADAVEGDGSARCTVPSEKGRQRDTNREGRRKEVVSWDCIIMIISIDIECALHFRYRF